MRALSAHDAFVPLLSGPYSTISDHHDQTSLDPNCQGCHVSAEGAFMHAMRAWEWFVKDLLTDLMAGRVTAHRLPVPIVRSVRYSSWQDARNGLLRSRFDANTSSVTLKNRPGNYLLLHNPLMVAAVARYWLSNSTVEAVFAGYAQQIERVLHIRHGISHGTRHAQAQARTAMMTFAPLHTYASIGAFLTDYDYQRHSTYLEHLLSELTFWATEMSP